MSACLSCLPPPPPHIPPEVRRCARGGCHALPRGRVQMKIAQAVLERDRDRDRVGGREREREREVARTENTRSMVPGLQDVMLQVL